MNPKYIQVDKCRCHNGHIWSIPTMSHRDDNDIPPCPKCGHGAECIGQDDIPVITPENREGQVSSKEDTFCP